MIISGPEMLMGYTTECLPGETVVYPMSISGPEIIIKHHKPPKAKFRSQNPDSIEKFTILN